MSRFDKITGESCSGIHHVFNALREEMLQWQRIRVDLLKGYLAVSGVLITAIFAIETEFPWQVLPIIQSCIGIILIDLFHYAAIGNVKAGAYIKVFLESNETGLSWEKRLQKYKPAERSLIATGAFNAKAAKIFIATPIITGVFISFKSTQFDRIWFTLFAVFVYLISTWYIWRKANKSYPAKECIYEWEKVLRNEQSQQA